MAAKDDKEEVHETTLYIAIKTTQWPIVYTQEYNIGFCGLEKLHPFDAGKWGKVYQFLLDAGMIRADTIVRPNEAQTTDLMVVHPKKYIDSLKWSARVAAITEVPPVAMLPNFLVQRKVLKPFRFQTGGTILAAKLAVERGWSINIGGGFHHCSASKGGGFCAYADITLSIKFLFQRCSNVKKAMIIDLDAHQGNGHERDFMEDENVYILDVFNRGIYPHDGFAKRGIDRKVELDFYTEDVEYLRLVRRHVEGALNEFTPDIIVYNAGTDILDGDPLGCLSITPQGIIERDQIVFQKARTRGIPVMMVTSGGYQKTTAKIIADSILNLHELSLITWDPAENAPLPPAPAGSTLPRSASDTGIWARFRRSTNCMDMTRSRTQEGLDKICESQTMHSELNLSRAGTSANEVHIPQEHYNPCERKEISLEEAADTDKSQNAECSMDSDKVQKKDLCKYSSLPDNETVCAGHKEDVIYTPEINHDHFDSTGHREEDIKIVLSTGEEATEAVACITDVLSANHM